MYRGRILTFKLGGEAQLPETQITYLNVPEPQKIITPEQRNEGELLFARYCAVCMARVPVPLDRFRTCCAR